MHRTDPDRRKAAETAQTENAKTEIPARTLWLAAVILLTLVAAALAAVALVPPGLFPSLVGDAGHRARLLAGGVLAIVAALALFRGAVQGFLADAWTSAPELLEDIAGGARALLDRSERGHLVALATLTLLALATRGLFLGVPPDLDEARTFVAYAFRPLYIALSWYDRPNNHLLHTLFVHMTYLVGGTSVWVLRLPALFAGVLLIPATYVLARQLYDRHAAVLAAGLVAVAFPLLLYSVRARGYTLLVLFFIVGAMLVRYLEDRHSAAACVALAVATALGFYTMPTMAYGAAVLGLWLLVSATVPGSPVRLGPRLRETAAWCAMTGVLVFLLYLPVLLVSGLGWIPLAEIAAIARPEARPGFGAALLVSLSETWYFWHRDLPPGTSLVLAAAALLSTVAHTRVARNRIPVALVAGLACAAFVIVHRVVPPARTWVLLQPLYLIAAAAGIAWTFRAALRRWPALFRRGVPVLAVAIGTGLGAGVVRGGGIHLLQVHDGFTAPEQVVEVLASRLDEGDAVLVAGRLSVPARYHFFHSGLPLSHLRAFREDRAVERLFIVVHDPVQTLEELLVLHDLDESFEAPQPLGSYGNVSLYMARRLAPRPAGVPPATSDSRPR